MAPAELAGQLESAHASLAAAGELLIAASDGAMERCRNQLEEAIENLKGCRPISGSAREALLEKAIAVRRQVLRAAGLLESGAAFYRGWERILGAMSGGYTASGAPAAARHPGKLNFRG